MNCSESYRKKSTMDKRLLASVDHAKRCKCGKFNSPNANVCWDCGKPLLKGMKQIEQKIKEDEYKA